MDQLLTQKYNNPENLKLETLTEIANGSKEGLEEAVQLVLKIFNRPMEEKEIEEKVKDVMIISAIYINIVEGHIKVEGKIRFFGSDATYKTIDNICLACKEYFKSSSKICPFCGFNNYEASRKILNIA
jgi:hypothetical protein